MGGAAAVGGVLDDAEGAGEEEDVEVTVALQVGDLDLERDGPAQVIAVVAVRRRLAMMAAVAWRGAAERWTRARMVAPS